MQFPAQSHRWIGAEGGKLSKQYRLAAGFRAQAREEIKWQRFISIIATATEHTLESVSCDGHHIHPAVAGKFLGKHRLHGMQTALGVAIAAAGDERQHRHASHRIGQSTGREV